MPKIRLGFPDYLTVWTSCFGRTQLLNGGGPRNTPRSTSVTLPTQVDDDNKASGRDKAKGSIDAVLAKSGPTDEQRPDQKQSSTKMTLPRYPRLDHRGESRGTKPRSHRAPNYFKECALSLRKAAEAMRLCATRQSLRIWTVARRSTSRTRHRVSLSGSSPAHRARLPCVWRVCHERIKDTRLHAVAAWVPSEGSWKCQWYNTILLFSNL